MYSEPIAIDNPDGDTIGVSQDLAAIAGNKPGTYVVRLLRGPDVLAEGTVTLTK